MDNLPSTSKMQRLPNKNKKLTEAELLKLLEEDSDECVLSGSEYNPSDEEESDIEDESNSDSSLLDENARQSVKSNDQQNNDDEWYEVDCTHLRLDIQFPGNESYVYDDRYPQNRTELTPFHVYRKLIDDEILQLIVEETNRNAAQVKNAQRYSRSSRIHAWKPTNKEEILKFLGCVMYMGVVKLPKIADYWSKSPLYNFTFISSVMTRNRFQLLLRFLHFADNTAALPNDRCHKIRKLFEMTQLRFAQQCNPGSILVIDESMIPFRGRLLFKQYIPSK
uniref:PiggyBac transposable element-derived protein 4-like n=1 Tax=Diabrotica virgifera virgifera TaxID=50390 RepID=A0A6P7FDS3_DIAVI